MHLSLLPLLPLLPTTPLLLLLLLLLTHSTFSLSLLHTRNDETSSPSYTSNPLFRATILNTTNTYRKQHNASALAWNATLAEGAQAWSRRCVFEHSGGPDGENLAAGYPNASASIIAWGHERVEYDFREGGFSHSTGHFTQLVWKATTSVGCGRTQCNGEQTQDAAPGWFVVCTYHPPGNILTPSAFTQNVQPAIPAAQQFGPPSDPEVPDGAEGEEKCPLGGDCSAGIRVSIGKRVWMIAVLVVVACLV